MRRKRVVIRKKTAQNLVPKSKMIIWPENGGKKAESCPKTVMKCRDRTKSSQ